MAAFYTFVVTAKGIIINQIKTKNCLSRFQDWGELLYTNNYRTACSRFQVCSNTLALGRTKKFQKVGKRGKKDAEAVKTQKNTN